MTLPYITSATAGLLLLIQLALAFAVSRNRGMANARVGDGGDANLLRTTRRHANLAENAGSFVIGFLLAGAPVWVGVIAATGVSS